jgi:hypothetical protein
MAKLLPYHALRLAGNRVASFRVAARGWALQWRRIVTLCSCALAQWNDQQISEVMHGRPCALERLDADWQVFALPKFLGFESRW